MKKLICLCLAAVLALSLFACGGNADPATSPDVSPSATPDASPSPVVEASDLEEILAKGELVIGFTDYAPMNYYDVNGVLIGYDTDFAKALCEKLGVTPKFELINWDTKEIELQSGNIDCIWNGLTVNDERRDNMDFTTSYLRNEQVVIIRAENAGAYVDAANLAGKTVVAEEGSAGAAAVEHDLPDSTFVGVAAQSTALLEVKAGTADAAVIDFTMARAMTGEGTDYADLMIVTTIKMMPEEYAIGLRLGSDCVAEFNGIIAELYADGTLAALAEMYDLSDLLIEQ